MRRIMMLVTSALLLAGCRPLDGLDFSPIRLEKPAAPLPASLGETKVVVAVSPATTEDLLVAAERFDVPLRSGLERSLDWSNLFDEKNPRKITVVMTLFKLDVPPKDEVYTPISVGAGARYDLIDQKDGTLLFTTEVFSSGFSAGVGLNSRLRRARSAVGDALKNNLQQFIVKMQAFADARRLPPAR